MDANPTRRRVLEAGVAAIGVALAGCSGGDGDESDDTATTTDESTEGPTTEETRSDPAAGEATGESTAEETTDEPTTEEPSTEESSEQNAVYETVDSYSFDGEGTTTSADGSSEYELTGVYDDPNLEYEMHGSSSGTDFTLDLYVVDGEQTVVGENGCGVQMSRPPHAFQVLSREDTSMADLEPVETTTVDGESTEVYEPDGEMLVEHESDLEEYEEVSTRLFVSTETRYIVRSEWAYVLDDGTETSMTIDHHTFGESHDIEAPEPEC